MEIIQQLLRFVGVGVIATAIHVLTALASRDLLQIEPVTANVFGFAVATSFGYVGHARITFKEKVWRSEPFFRFIFLGVISLIFSSFTVWILTVNYKLSFYISMLVVGISVPILNFVILKLWVFGTLSKLQKNPVAGIVFPAMIAISVLFTLWDRPINHDTAWYLLATKEWLGGGILYTDIIEVNPPLNFYFTIPAIWISELFHISEKNSQYIVISSLICVALAWCHQIILSNFRIGTKKTFIFIAMLAASVILPAVRDFAQREQIFVLLAMPWLLGQAAPTPPTRREDISRAVVAAIGMCLKPHFVLLPIAVILLKIWQQKSLRPVFAAGNFAFLAVGLLYITLVATLHPSYFNSIIPMAQDVYGAYGTTWINVIYRVALPISCCALLAVAVARRGSSSNPAILFLVASLAAFAFYLLQGAGFSYHRIPLKSFLMTTAVCLLIINRNRDLSSVIALVAFLGIGAYEISRGFYSSDLSAEVVDVAEAAGGVNTLMAISTELPIGPGPALEMGSKWASHYPASWLVPGSVNRLDTSNCAVEPQLCARLVTYLDRNRKAIIDDIKSTSPDMLIIHTDYHRFNVDDFSWLAYMAEDPNWGPTFAQYTLFRTTDRALYYRLN